MEAVQLAVSISTEPLRRMEPWFDAGNAVADSRRVIEPVMETP